MKCKLCGSLNTEITYKGLIRDGGLGKYTNKDVEMYKCSECGVIWHEPMLNNKNYYESQEYRQALEGTIDEQDFYKLHDKESYEKFTYTGTTIFRNKIVADIGCGCGAFLDYINGVADKVIAIEPTKKYREIMDKKGFETYDYAISAIKEFKEKVDVVITFDVIEHVENPLAFLEDIYNLLKTNNSKAIIGTPTDAPVMRKMLGEDYEKKLLFSTQHLWIFAEKNLRLLAQEAGFKEISFKYYQRYGIDNFLGWLCEKEPRKDKKEEFITDTLNSVWKIQLSEQGLSDYIVMYLQK